MPTGILVRTNQKPVLLNNKSLAALPKNYPGHRIIAVHETVGAEGLNIFTLISDDVPQDDIEDSLTLLEALVVGHLCAKHFELVTDLQADSRTAQIISSVLGDQIVPITRYMMAILGHPKKVWDIQKRVCGVVNKIMADDGHDCPCMADREKALDKVMKEDAELNAVLDSINQLPGEA